MLFFLPSVSVSQSFRRNQVQEILGLKRLEHKTGNHLGVKFISLDKKIYVVVLGFKNYSMVYLSVYYYYYALLEAC